MSDESTRAAKTSQDVQALALKVSREGVEGEFDLRMRSPDPVGAVILLLNLELSACVVPAAKYYHQKLNKHQHQQQLRLQQQR
jgi:predicted metalloendopeptidase